MAAIDTITTVIIATITTTSTTNATITNTTTSSYQDIICCLSSKLAGWFRVLLFVTLVYIVYVVNVHVLFSSVYTVCSL